MALPGGTTEEAVDILVPIPITTSRPTRIMLTEDGAGIRRLDTTGAHGAVMRPAATRGPRATVDVVAGAEAHRFDAALPFHTSAPLRTAVALRTVVAPHMGQRASTAAVNIIDRCASSGGD